jgi:hypothetical protein
VEGRGFRLGRLAYSELPESALGVRNGKLSFLAMGPQMARRAILRSRRDEREKLFLLVEGSIALLQHEQHRWLKVDGCPVEDDMDEWIR